MPCFYQALLVLLTCQGIRNIGPYTIVRHVINGTNKNRERTTQVLICICPSTFNVHTLEVEKHALPSPFYFLS